MAKGLERWATSTRFVVQQSRSKLSRFLGRLDGDKPHLSSLTWVIGNAAWQTSRTASTPNEALTAPLYRGTRASSMASTCTAHLLFGL